MNSASTMVRVVVLQGHKGTVYIAIKCISERAFKDTLLHSSSSNDNRWW